METTAKAEDLGIRRGEKVIFVSKTGRPHECTVIAVDDNNHRIALTGPDNQTMWYGSQALPALKNLKGATVGHLVTKELCAVTDADFKRLADKTGGDLLDTLIAFDNQHRGFDISHEQLKQLRVKFHAYASLMSMRHRCRSIGAVTKPSPCAI